MIWPTCATRCRCTRLRANGNGPEPYYLGFFLMGAYQDIMGDLHNLFGRVNEVHVFLDPDEPAGYYVEEIIEGSTIVQALTSVQYDENELKRQMKMQMDEAIKSDRLKPSEGMRLLDDFERGLKDYTYLTSMTARMEISYAPARIPFRPFPRGARHA